MRKILIAMSLLAAGAGLWIHPAPLLTLPARPPRPPEPPAIAWHKAVPIPVYEPGERIGEIKVPRLHLSVAVYEGDDASILDAGAGHVPGTALPGSDGNICIAAHRDRFFRALRFIKPHDELVLETASGTVRYSVASTAIVKPSQTEVLMPAPHRDLTLVTCYPFFFVGSAPRRFIVHAEKIG